MRAESESARVTLRQLCKLGLPAPMLLPSVLPVLRALVPASHAGFFFCDALGSITNLYAERLLPPQVMAAYHDRHNDEQFRLHYLARVAATGPVSWRSLGVEERRSAYYRDVLQPLGIGHVLYAVVRHEGRVLGQLSLYREEGAAAFQDADARRLLALLHYLGRGLSVPAPVTPRAQQGQCVETALAVFDLGGAELFADAHWARLIRLAHGDAITPATAMLERVTLPRFVAAVLAAARDLPLAAHEVNTGWGHFIFRRHALQTPVGEPAVALLLSRLAPEPLCLTHGAAALGLSPQQREVAVLIAGGLSNAEIAKRLGVGANTAAFHAKQVFLRLGVHSRADVARVLTAAADLGSAAAPATPA